MALLATIFPLFTPLRRLVITPRADRCMISLVMYWV